MAVRITSSPLSVARAYAGLEDPRSGGAVLFLGRVRRDRRGGGTVRGLEYEAHRTLTERAFATLERQARQRFGARRVILWHRLGKVPVGAPSVIIGVAAPHRDAAFAAARFLIDRLKHTAPIWKTDLAENPRGVTGPKRGAKSTSRVQAR